MMEPTNRTPWISNARRALWALATVLLMTPPGVAAEGRAEVSDPAHDVAFNGSNGFFVPLPSIDLRHAAMSVDARSAAATIRVEDLSRMDTEDVAWVGASHVVRAWVTYATLSLDPHDFDLVLLVAFRESDGGRETYLTYRIRGDIDDPGSIRFERGPAEGQVNVATNEISIRARGLPNQGIEELFAVAFVYDCEIETCGDANLVPLLDGGPVEGIWALDYAPNGNALTLPTLT